MSTQHNPVKRRFGKPNAFRSRHFRKKKRPNRKKVLNIRAGSDSRLKDVFKNIGIPDEKPFKPDAVQIEALDAIRQSDCLVTAPTGFGKTWIAEQAINDIIDSGGRTWYATPLKALSNAIYSHFKKLFGVGYVGILTGDRKENPEAPIIVGTTEILRNQLYDSMHRGEDLGTDFVVLDEAHFLGDVDRGVVWEEILIYLPSRIPVLMLSATIGNADQIAQWLKSIRLRECIVVEETKRPVPLYPLFFHPSGTLFPLLATGETARKTIIHKKVVPFLREKKNFSLAVANDLPPMGDILRVLRKYKLLPAIFFMKSRLDCDRALTLCTEEALANDPERKERISRRVAELVSQSPHITHHKQLGQLEHMAVGSHHSGQLPAWKIVVETLMKEGLLDAVFATSTVAAGVNFPARTVVLLNSDRFNGVEFIPLNATEFHQMTGRAGRRGMDNIGFALMLPGKFNDLKLVAKLMNAPPSNVISQIRINFSMVLNLLLSHTPKQIEELLEKCFATFVHSTTAKKRTLAFFEDDHRYLWRDFLQHLSFLKETDYVSPKDQLTEDGLWASQLRIDHPLMVAEAFRLGVIPKDDPEVLAAVMAAFVNEREFNDDSIGSEDIPKRLVGVFLNIKKRLKPFVKKMNARGFEAKPLYLRPALLVYDWATGKPWEKIVRNNGLADGDIAKLILRTSDNLRHVRNLSKIFPEVGASASIAIELIEKEPIVSYYET